MKTTLSSRIIIGATLFILFCMIMMFALICLEHTHAQALAEPKYKIAILDTGYDAHIARYKLKTCKTGHFDYASKQPFIGHASVDHGTYVAQTIARQLYEVDYCAVIYQISGPDGEFATANEVDALRRARGVGVVAVNLSFRSNYFDYKEHHALQETSDAGIKIFSAAGNENQDLDRVCNVYPPCYRIKNMIVVGAITADNDAKASYSNYGQKVNAWYPGTFTDGLTVVKGTSFAAPYALGQYLLFLSDQHPAPKAK